jgi:CRP/FNR family transcriptional regulator, dissimilatory nitrate respiration regulator
MHVSVDRAGIPGAAPGLAAQAVGERRQAHVMRLLRQLPLFEGVLPAEAETAFSDAAVLTCGPGTVLFEAGMPAETLYVVVVGRIRLSFGGGRDTGGSRLLGVLGSGDTIGLAALLRGELYAVTAVVVDDALLVALPVACVQRLMDEQPAIAARLVGDMGAKLARFVRDVGGFAQRSARARVARLLDDLHRSVGAGADAAEISFGEPKRLIASRLAMTPETLSRELHALAESGLIESRRTRFRVLDAAGLTRAAEDGGPALAR